MTGHTDTAWGLASLPADEWLEHAACNPATAELFWPTGQGVPRDVAYALSICGQCPVIKRCGEYAVEHKQTEGIWGGMREDQLRFLITGIADGRRTHVEDNCARCGKFRDLTGRSLCISCTASVSAKGELQSYPKRDHGPGRLNAVKTHCPEGHAYDEANTYIDPNSHRHCRRCKNIRNAKRQKAEVPS